MRYPGLSGDVVGTIDYQTLRNKTLVDPMIIVDGIPVSGGGSGGGILIADSTNGKYYRLIAVDGIIGLEEV